MAAGRTSGLAGREFCPLTADLRDARPELVAVFAERFAEYRTRVVEPFVLALKACHALIVLVDVPTLLAAGVGMYDDFRHTLRELFRVLAPGETTVERVGRHLADVFLPHDWRPGGITRVAFVAPKLDLVHPGDRDHVLHLLKHLVGRLAGDADGLAAGFFPCAAVVSTKPLPGDGRQLVGVPFRDADGRKVPPAAEQRFGVSGGAGRLAAQLGAGRVRLPGGVPAGAGPQGLPARPARAGPGAGLCSVGHATACRLRPRRHAVACPTRRTRTRSG